MMVRLGQLFLLIVHIQLVLTNKFKILISKINIYRGGKMEKDYMYVTKESMESLIKNYGLPECDEFSQDWEYEIADSSKVKDYVSIYENEDLNNEEKFTLMIVIIGSFEDMINVHGFDKKIWKKIKNMLIEDIGIHKNTIIYWASCDNEIEDSFSIAPNMREIIKKNNL